MQFKTIAGLSILAVIIIGVIFGPTFRDLAQQRLREYLNQATEEQEIELKTTRDIPQNIDLGAFLAGNMAFSQNHYSSATDYYEKVLEKDSHFSDIRARLFMLYGIQGKMPQLFQSAHDLESADYSLMFRDYVILADLIRKEKYEEALTYFKTHSSEAPQFLNSLTLAWIYVGLQKKTEAFQALENIDERLNGLKIQHQAMLHMYFNEKDKAKEKILLFNNTVVPVVNSWYYILDILSFDELLNQPKLLMQFQQALVDNVYLSEVLAKNVLRPIYTPQTGIGNVFYLFYVTFETMAKQNRSHEAKVTQTENELVLLNTAEWLNDQLLYQLIVLEKSLDVKLYQQTLNICDTLLKEKYSPRLKDYILYQKVLALIGLKRIGEALKISYNMTQNNTLNLKIYELLINVSAVLGYYQDTLNYFSKIMSFPSVQGDSVLLSRLYTDRSGVYYQMNRPKEMIDDLQKAISLNDKNVEALNSLGYELIDKEIDVAKGLALVQKANQLAPQKAYITDSVAWGYYKSGQYDKAVRFGEAAVRQAHDSAVINVHLGDIYQKLGRKNEAMAQYRKALMMKQDLTPEMKKDIQNKLNEKISAPASSESASSAPVSSDK